MKPSLINLVTVILFCTNCVFSARILGVFMTPSYSHQIVYQPIWKELSLRGHDVTVITPNPLHDPRLTNLTEIDLSSSYKIFKEGNEESILEEKSLVSEIIRMPNLYGKLSHYQLSHPKFQAFIKKDNQSFDLLLVEYLYPTMYALKDVFNCPMIGITSIGLTAFGNEFIGNPKHPAFDPDFFMPTSISTTFEQRFFSTILDAIMRWPAKYIAMIKMDKLLAQYIGGDIRPLSKICQEFSLVITNSNLAIRNAKPMVPNLIEISGIHIPKPKPLPYDLKRFLDNCPEGVIYFSLGTNMKSALIPEEKLQDLIQVFSKLPYKVLWKFEKDHLPNQPKNVEIRKWVPQTDVLAHPNVKLFITQGGIQSIDEAISRRVPMLLIPVFADQHFNAHHVVTRGGGLSLDYHKLSRANFKKALLELMYNPKYQNHIDQLSSIASDQIVPALDKAIWWIEYVLRHDGAKHLTYYAGRDAPFYQYYMLDILALSVISIVAVICIVVIAARAVIRYFKPSSAKSKTN